MSLESELELRSEKVRKLLGEIPPMLISAGIVVIVAILFALIMIVCFVPYPYSEGESILRHWLYY